MKYISKIGLEIEGGWFSTEDKPESLTSWHHDDSVRNIRKTQNGVPIRFIGEAVSIPLANLSAVHEWINIYWPDRKNKSCGFHIHTSFVDPKFYWYLVNEDFYIQFYKKMKAVGNKLHLSAHFFDRLMGKNVHCQKLFKGREQLYALTKTNNRYSQLNYCYSLHGTLENRLPCAILPIRKAQQYVDEYIQFIENYLEAHPKPEITEFNWETKVEVEDENEKILS